VDANNTLLASKAFINIKMVNGLSGQSFTLRGADQLMFLGSWFFARRFSFGFPPGAGGAGRRPWLFAPPRWSIVAPRGLAVG